METVSSSAEVQSSARKRWLELLASSPAADLDALMEGLNRPAYQWLRKPQVGLYMLRGRVGGDGDSFNLGEVPVTRCVLRVDASAQQAIIGLGYTLGRSPRHATLCAIADAMLQDADYAEQVRADVLLPLELARAQRERQADDAARATRVEFYTVARESQLADTP